MNYHNIQTSLICDIVKSDAFRNRLISINTNYPNLKQEAFIRNAILEMLNEHFYLANNPTLKAFAEHPRKHGRVDLSIIDKDNLENPFLIEFKYQFPYDIVHYVYSNTIKRDFHARKFSPNKQTDLFVLFIASWEKEPKIGFDNIWGIDSDLSRYQLTGKQKEDEWNQQIVSDFSNETKGTLIKWDNDQCYYRIDINSRYKMYYQIYILERRSNE